MSCPSRSLSGHFRSLPSSANAASAVQSPALVARVNEKKAELEDLEELRNLSAAMASQMEALEEKLSSLADGTEAISLVLANWSNVIKNISMASKKFPKPKKTKRTNEGASDDVSLPTTLVRIPTENAQVLQAQVEAAKEDC